MRFELTVPGDTAYFKYATLDHSAIHPYLILIRRSTVQYLEVYLVSYFEEGRSRGMDPISDSYCRWPELESGLDPISHSYCRLDRDPRGMTSMVRYLTLLGCLVLG